ncbi:hypothetical protein QTN25_001902 [Entamoeba marina]
MGNQHSFVSESSVANASVSFSSPISSFDDADQDTLLPILESSESKSSEMPQRDTLTPTTFKQHKKKKRATGSLSEKPTIYLPKQQQTCFKKCPSKNKSCIGSPKSSKCYSPTYSPQFESSWKVSLTPKKSDKWPLDNDLELKQFITPKRLEASVKQQNMENNYSKPFSQKNELIQYVPTPRYYKTDKIDIKSSTNTKSLFISFSQNTIPTPKTTNQYNDIKTIFDDVIRTMPNVDSTNKNVRILYDSCLEELNSRSFNSKVCGYENIFITIITSNDEIIGFYHKDVLESPSYGRNKTMETINPHLVYALNKSFQGTLKKKTISK